MWNNRLYVLMVGEGLEGSCLQPLAGFSTGGG